ncbi:hypothetical protein BJ165DRAFT_1524222 [Panaeolus papilionaceus]|nr:hypothetical protein BJ165DRAFT_1524222 [Panaeolus papilionaceus]
MARARIDSRNPGNGKQYFDESDNEEEEDEEREQTMRIVEKKKKGGKGSKEQGEQCEEEREESREDQEFEGTGREKEDNGDIESEGELTRRGGTGRKKGQRGKAAGKENLKMAKATSGGGKQQSLEEVLERLQKAKDQSLKDFERSQWGNKIDDEPMFGNGESNHAGNKDDNHNKDLFNA